MNILMPFWRKTAGDRNFYEHFFERLARAAGELGHSVTRFEYAAPGEVLPAERDRLYRQLLQNEFDFVLDLCCKGSVHLSERVWDGSDAGEPLLDSVGVPYVGMLFDQVYFQVGLAAARAARLYVTLPDAYHHEQLALIYPELGLAGSVLVPPAVQPADDHSTVAWGDRPVEVLYVGNIDPGMLRGRWLGGDCPALLNAVADEALADASKPLHRCFQEVTSALGQPATPQLALYVLPLVEKLLRARLRYAVILAAAKLGRRLCVVGSGWDGLELPADVTTLAPVDYDAMLAMYGSAKICLNVSTYLGGADDRLFGGSVNGALCMTNADRYASESYGSDGGVEFYSMRQLEDIPDRLHALLADENNSAQRAGAAREVTLSQHTWRHRLQNIIQVVSVKS